MPTYYLIDFENVGNDGIKNISSLTGNDHVHIFSTEKAPNIRMDLVFRKNVDVNGHIVPIRKQSLDMHLVTYLGHLMGVHGKECKYVIVSKDTDYDNIIDFWKQEGYPNITRQTQLNGPKNEPKTAVKTGGKATATGKPPMSKRELQIRAFFGQHFKKEIYTSHKEQIISIILHGQTKQQINTELMKLYKDGKVVSHIYQTIQPLIEDMRGQ